MNKFASALVLAAALVVPAAAYAGDAKDASSNVDHKTPTKDGKASPGTVGAMNNGAEGGSFTASKKDQGKDLTKPK